MAGALPDETCTGCSYGLWNVDGSFNDKFAKTVSRTYAQKVAGRTLVQHFDWKQGGMFTLVFAMNTDIEAPTIIFTNLKYWYPDGFRMDIEPQDTVRTSINGQYIELYNSQNQTDDGKNVTVTITPK